MRVCQRRGSFHLTDRPTSMTFYQSGSAGAQPDGPIAGATSRREAFPGANSGLRLVLSVVLVALGCSPAAAQTTAFSDNFNRGSLTVGAPAAYTTTVTG